MTSQHAHEWVVFSTALQDQCLMLQCVGCGDRATVDDPSIAEWQAAFRAPSRPYRWHDESRLTMRESSPLVYSVLHTTQSMPCECYEYQGTPEPGDYERMPSEILGRRMQTSEADKKHLHELAEFVAGTDLCSHFFPLFLQSHEQMTGVRQPASAKEIINRIKNIDTRGLHFSAGIVARVLREWAS